MPLSYRNKSTDLQIKAMDLFLYKDFLHERFKYDDHKWVTSVGLKIVNFQLCVGQLC